MRKISFIFVLIFTTIGLGFTAVFVLLQFGLLNVKGSISDRNASIASAQALFKDAGGRSDRVVILCRIHAIADFAPQTAGNIQTAYENTGDGMLANRMIAFATIRFASTNLPQVLDRCNQATIPDTTPLQKTSYAWADSPEWAVMQSAFIRDQDTIRRAAADAGISPRLLLGGVIGEQFRFFTSSRDSFKRYFEPLKILASLSQFSYGIAGLKPETTAAIDAHLTDSTSPFYLGPAMEHVITYPDGADHVQTRFDRITNTKDSYYSYLYTGLFMRQIIAQWQRAGYDISHDPGALATLFNLGFSHSIPKTDPSPGGAPITVNGQQYNFGELGEQFYYSGELIQEFPY